MPMPTDVPLIDLMLGIPSEQAKRSYDFMRPLFRDADSLKSFDFPVEYMFKDVPKFSSLGDRIQFTLQEMDKWGIERALIGVSFEDEVAQQALREHSDRFIASANADPNHGVEGLRDIVRLHEAFDVRAVSAFPAGCVPQVPIDDKRFYPVYAKCVELDVPIFCCVGVPGPRIPMACQHVERIDEVMWFFPELKFVMRHGAEPWEELAVKLMLKWPNLYYSTSAFAPRYYPKAIVDYANTRGPTRSSTRATSPWASRWSGSWATCRTCRSAITSGPASCARTPSRCSGWTGRTRTSPSRYRRPSSFTR